jgi:TPR repeat protein
VSDLYDAGQSPLRAAHKYLVARDPLYRVALAAAPIALAVALLAATVSAIWTPATPLPPPAVPATPAPPQAPASPAAPPQAPAPRVDYQALRDRAVNDAAARSDLLARADTGDAEAQFWAATLYDPLLPDVRFAKDGAVAVQWYAKSAAQGDMSSENNLGGLYENGLGVAQDTAMAAHWYRKAADQGDSSAENNLGRLYESGNGVPKDEAEAVRWYRMAADQGYAPAESNLGRVYEAGLGIAKDEATAAMWYAKAAQAGLANAQLRLGYLYESGRGVGKDPAAAADWFRKAAAQQDPDAENELGRTYALGVGVPRNYERALALFRRAAAKGQSAALYNLALALDSSWGMPRDPVAAYIWYSIAARAGLPERREAAATARDRLAAQLPPAELGAAQTAAENWRPGVVGYIGVRISDLTPDQAKAIGSTQPGGALVTEVATDGPAQRAGLLPQDVITAFDGQPTYTAAALHQLVTFAVPGEFVTLLVERSSQRGFLQELHLEVGQLRQ